MTQPSESYLLLEFQIDVVNTSQGPDEQNPDQTLWPCLVTLKYFQKQLSTGTSTSGHRLGWLNHLVCSL